MPEDFQTNQTVVAAFFCCKGLELLRLRWSHGTCNFYFAATEELEDLLDEFVRGEARVEPQAFNNTFGDLKRRMNQAKNGG